MHLLVAVDRSPESENALVNALDIVTAVEGTVTAVHATPSDDGAGEGDGRAVLRTARECAEKRDIEIETELLVGDPSGAIAEYAETHDVDAIYVGHRGLASTDGELPGDRRGPLGSVAKGLVERTKVPVSVFDRGL